MEVYLVKHGGPEAWRIAATAHFLRNSRNFNDKTIILHAPHIMPKKSAYQLRKLLSLKARQVKRARWLRFRKCSNGNFNHQIMSTLYVFAANHQYVKNIIIVSHRREIKHTIDAFADMLLPVKARSDFCSDREGIERGSVYYINEQTWKIKKIFTP